MRIASLKKAHDIAEKIDAYVAKHGLPPKINSGLSRFNYVVTAIHEEGSIFTYEHAYCVCYKRWLMIFPEHHEINILHIDDLISYSITKPQPIPHIEFDDDNIIFLEPMEKEDDDDVY